MVAPLRQFFGDLIDLLGALMRVWWALIAVLVAGVPITLWDRTHDVPVGLETLQVPLLIAFLVAFPIAWGRHRRTRGLAEKERDESRDALAAKERDLHERTTALVSVRGELDQERQRHIPNIQGVVGNPFYSELAGTTPRRLVVILPITLKNPPPGAPSAIDSWRVRLILNNQEELLVPEAISTPMTFPTAVGTFAISPGDDIVANTASKAIGTGDIRNGYLAMMVSGKTIDSINGGSLVICFRDICGKFHELRVAADTSKLTPFVNTLPGTSARFSMTPDAVKEMFYSPAAGLPKSSPSPSEDHD